MRHLGLDLRPEVYWGGEPGGDGRGGQVPARCARGRWGAHAHVHGVKDGAARICVRRGHESRGLIQHEVAHFAPGGGSHGVEHLRAMARTGHTGARMALVRDGRARCPKHHWNALAVKSERVTSAGLVRVLAAQCIRCRKVIG